jgi:L-alanine-DL-glutamate epimerase-like enolase superfamily enzyme
MNQLEMKATVEQWPLTAPFRITGRTWYAVDVLVVSLEREGRTGYGEAAGIYYKNDTPDIGLEKIESLRKTIEAGINRDTLQALLPACGARNALDCALWDLEAKLSGCAVWELAGLRSPGPLATTFTCSAEEPEAMARTALGYSAARAIKVKLTGQAVDAARVLAVREARQDVWLGVDANQGFTREFFDWIMPVLIKARVELIEQPFPIGQERLLDGLRSPIRIAADESVQSSLELESLVGRVNVVNIKLDKCGGLTEGLAMARAAHQLGFATMVGNMLGTSLATAPSYLLGQLCEVVDLDGPVFLQRDRLDCVQYFDGMIYCPESLWGSARRS